MECPSDPEEFVVTAVGMLALGAVAVAIAFNVLDAVLLRRSAR